MSDALPLRALIARLRAAGRPPADALDQLRNHQKQLDMDGVMVGVSRQALEEVLATFNGSTEEVGDG